MVLPRCLLNKPTCLKRTFLVWQDCELMECFTELWDFLPRVSFRFFTSEVFLQTVFALNIIRGDVAGAVGCVADSPPGLGIIQQPQALVLPDVQFLVLLSCVVPLGYNNHLLCHLSSSPTARREKEQMIWNRRAESPLRNWREPK